MIDRARGDIRRLLTMTIVGAITFIATEAAAVADLPLVHHFGVGGVGYGIINVVWGVDAVGWRPVYLGGGLVDIACAVALAVSLRWTPGRPAEPGPVPRAAGP